MNHGSLFSGVGGFDLAAEWMGWENKFHCEWNPFGQRVLKHYWPNATSYSDITKTDFTIHRGSIDILTGGFPCQPYSVAGKRKGKEDERHLWPEMLRAIREIQPTWVVGENVSGLINWNGGMVFDEVQADLEAEGYEVIPFVLPACGVNAPHRRDRVWFVAYATSKRKQSGQQSGWDAGRVKQLESAEQGRNSYNNDAAGITTNTDSNGQHRSNSEDEKHTGKGRQYAQRNIEHGNGKGVTSNTISQRFTGKEYREKESGLHSQHSKGNDWLNFPTQSPVCNGNDGFPAELDGITFSKWRNESIKAMGNAIVPQVALQIFKAIEQFEKLI